MPHVNFTPSNPNTTTREDFTQNILNVTIPDDADKGWADGVRHQQGLYEVLYEQEAMAPNRQQTFMTKANQKSAVYHLWDFVGRTIQYYYMVDYKKTINRKRGQEKEVYEDAVGRTAMSQILVEDTSGKAELMLNSNIDIRVEFNDAIKQAASAGY